MKAYVWVTFGFLALVYYELSGGAEFAPGDNGITVFAEVDPQVTQDIAERNAVTRLAFVDNTSVGPVDGAEAAPDQVALETAVLNAIRKPEAQPDADAGETRVTRVVSVEDTAPPRARKEDLRKVNGSRVNLRVGPGQDHGVLTKLARGTTVHVLEDPGTGWVRLQVVPQGKIGWIADYLLDQT